MELTQWFDFDKQKPWQEGVYEVAFEGDDDTAHSLWDGKTFMFLGFDVISAITFGTCETSHVILKWRGLSSNPNAKPTEKKSKGNKRKTVHVVSNNMSQPIGAFFIKHNAFLFAKKNYGFVKTIRFRTPEQK